MRALEKTHEQTTREHYYEYCVQFLSARVASICNACTGKKLTSTSKLLGSIAMSIAAVALCARAFVKFKLSRFESLPNVGINLSLNHSCKPFYS